MQSTSGEFTNTQATSFELLKGQKSEGLTISKGEDFKDPYQLALLNLSSIWVAIQFSFDKVNWYPTPIPIGKTCNRACNDNDILKCYNDGAFVVFATHNCGVQVKVYFKFRNDRGDIGTLNDPYIFDTPCEYKGKVLVFCD